MITTVVYWSHPNSGNTDRFVAKLNGVEKIRISNDTKDEVPVVDRPFCLIIPTYKGGAAIADTNLDTVPKRVKEFLQNPTNVKNAKLVSAGGNINFVEDYCAAGYQIERQYGIPFKHRFEMSGTVHEAEVLMEGLRTFDWRAADVARGIVKD